jgi:hypothetical protein
MGDENMGTEHKKVDTGALDAEITEDHCHPPRSFDTPTGRYRMGAIRFGSAAAGQNVVMGGAGGITYNFVAALGAPGAGICEVKVQGSTDLTVRKLAQATRGVVDAANIAYGAGTQPNPSAWGYYTSQRFSLAATAVLAGSNIVFYGIVPDLTDALNPLTLTTTTVGSTLTAFVRTYVTRYVLNGNAAALGNRVAGDMQMLIPMGAVINDSGSLVYYDPAVIVAEATNSASMIVEMDLYWSTDEITFNLMGIGLDISKDSTSAGALQFATQVQRIPPGGGLYTKMRSDGNAVTDWVEIKAHSHYYPLGV